MAEFTLTEDQLSIIEAPANQRMLVMAGPGTGKTETVARRLAHMIGNLGLRPSQILVLSFSRSAVKALVNRIRSLDLTDTPTLEELRFLSVRTFDSWTFRMLRFLGEEASDLLQNEFDENIEMLIARLNVIGNTGALESRELKFGNIRHLVVDEFQDLAGVRAELVQKLLSIITSSERSDENVGFTILGDPNQAIYDFSIASSTYSGDCGTSHLLTDWLKEQFDGELRVERLKKNHRSNVQIGELVAEAAEILVTTRNEGVDPVQPLEELLDNRLEHTDSDNLFEALVTGSQKGMAILCRSNSQILEINQQMQYLSFKKGKAIRDFYTTAGTPPDRLPAWIAKLLYQFKAGGITRGKFLQIFQIIFPSECKGAPCGGDGEAAWKLLLGYARSGEAETSLDMDHLRARIYWPDTLPDDEGVPDTRVTIATIHQSKGLEYQSVRMVKRTEGEDSGFEDCAEEGRVLFVGMSRAKDDLAILEFPSKYPFYLKSFENGRERWQRWIFGMTQLELGCKGDVDEESILRTDYMGSREIVEETQKYLFDNDDQLVGSPVTLVKTPIPGTQGRFVYRITLGVDGTGRCLGFLRQFIWKDILSLRANNKNWLPGKIHNLRVGAVTTSVSNKDLHVTVPAPWRESKFWLSVLIHGVGQYK